METQIKFIKNRMYYLIYKNEPFIFRFIKNNPSSVVFEECEPKPIRSEVIDGNKYYLYDIDYERVPKPTRIKKSDPCMGVGWLRRKSLSDLILWNEEDYLKILYLE